MQKKCKKLLKILKIRCKSVRMLFGLHNLLYLQSTCTCMSKTLISRIEPKKKEETRKSQVKHSWNELFKAQQLASLNTALVCKMCMYCGVFRVLRINCAKVMRAFSTKSIHLLFVVVDNLLKAFMSNVFVCLFFVCFGMLRNSWNTHRN